MLGYHENPPGRQLSALLCFSRNANSAWKKTPPNFVGVVAAGPRMNRLKDDIGHSWANRYTLTKRELKACSNFPAVLAGRGLGFLLPDT